MLTRRNCPEIEWSKAAGNWCVVSLRGVVGMVTAWDKDSGTPAGVLTLIEWLSGGIATLNHRLPAGKPPASSN